MNDNLTHRTSDEDSSIQSDNWSVWRQGDDGNAFLVEGNLSEETARQRVSEFEARGHKQLYWVTQQKS